MKVIIVYIGDILHCPPALSLVQILSDLNIQTTLCTNGNSMSELKNSIGELKNVSIKYVGDTYKTKISLLSKFLRMFNIRKKLWENINAIYDDDTIIWIVSEGSLKHLGKKILSRNYILHLLELNEGIYYISGNPLLKLNYKAYASQANVVLEAEYNRAHITKAWWELKELPMIYPNKPYNTINIKRYASITSSDNAKNLIEKLKGKKIILYQGNISKERPLEEYVKAVGELGDDYAFIMMLNGENPYPHLHYNNFYCLNFIKPPFHLEITSHAYIGVLSYTPIKNDYSILNTLYCAPNKIWEYSKFGIPMISNDLPSLREMFLEFKNGEVIPNYDKESIKKTILKIDLKYDEYSQESLKFYNSIDLKKLCNDVLNKAYEKV